MAKEPKEGILLETGTNEVEILEFLLNGQSFGVNVVKVQAIEQYNPDRVTVMPMAHPSMLGMLLFRERTIPLVDLGKDLEITSGHIVSDATEEDRYKIVLVLNFNQITTAILADAVDRIHRISWNDINPISETLARYATVFTGSVHIGRREILIVDMEKIMGQIIADASLQEVEGVQSDGPADKSEVKLVMAEDSPAMRTMIVNLLNKGGYENITAFDNGKAAYDHVQKLKQQAAAEDKDLSEYLTAVVSDIEMPQMDGLTLCKEIRTSLGLTDLPVLLFSSLINEQMAARCKIVGASDYVSKPETGKLLEALGKLCAVVA
jgi:two-component system chemotaxis response regulator CheV